MNPATSFYAPLSSATSMSAIDTSRSVSCRAWAFPLCRAE
ncbi:hypothetical protein WCP94_003525 [Bilophila wadsworthia]